MIRAFHRWPGLLALALVTILSLSGAALSVFPVVERIAAPQAEAGLSVATLADRVQAAYPGVEQIRRAPSGRITAYWFDQGVPGAAVIDPATGAGVAPVDPNQTQRWLTNLHRSLFLGDGGRIAMAAASAAMLILSLSGVVLVARRAGGWRRWFAPLRGPLAGRLHVEIADRRRGPRSVLCDSPLDDSRNLRTSARDRHHSGHADRGERSDGVRPGRHGHAATDAGCRIARVELSLCRRRDGCLHARDRPGHRIPRSGRRISSGMGRPDRMAARVGNHLYAAHGAGGGDTRPRSGADGPRGSPDGRDRRADLARRTARAATHPGQPARRARRDDHSRGQRGRQHLGLRRDAARRPDASRAERPCRADVGLRPRTLYPSPAHHPARRDLWRRCRTLLGQKVPRPAERP